MLRVIAISCIMILATNIAHSQSIADTINQDKKYNSQSADVTVFAFAYSLLKETDKVLLPMMDDPSASMGKTCKIIKFQARQWIYMNIVIQYNHILSNIKTLEKKLSLSGRAEVGPVTSRLIEDIEDRRGIMENARLLDLSAEIVRERLEDNDASIDKALIGAGDTVASSAFETFHEANIAKIKSVAKDIENSLQQNCQKSPTEKESYIDTLVE